MGSIKVSRYVTFSGTPVGYVGMPTMVLGREPQVTLRFKTTEPDGLLLYTANNDQSNYLSISLFDGLLVFRAKPGGDVLSSASVRYNDAEWHYISATKNDSHLQLVIDDYDVISKSATAINEVVSTTPIYFGGLPSKYPLFTGTAPTNKSFVGCIGDATINGKFQNFAETRDREGAELISCPLDQPQATVIPPLPGKKHLHS